MTNQVNEHLNANLHPRVDLDEMGLNDPASPYYDPPERANAVDSYGNEYYDPPERDDDIPQIIEGVEVDGVWSAREVPPLEPCSVCGFAQGAHDPAGNCPTEMQAREWYGR